MIMKGSHDSILVTLSVVIAIVASYTALDLAGRVRASSGYSRRLWLATAAIAMGGGIWSMHFVAMLAFKMPGMGVSYDVGLTMASLLVAIVATGAGFFLISRAEPGTGVTAASGLLMGSGVVAMHYIGMAAMRMPADLHYDHLWVTASVLIAIGAATAALWLASRNSQPYEMAAAAGLMGAAIAGMHYAGMTAAIFTARAHVDHAAGYAGVGQTTLAVAVATSTFLILFLALIAASFDRRIAFMAQREAQALRQSEERFRSLYEGTPLPLQSLDDQGRLTQVSNAWLKLMGYERDEVLGRPLINFMTEESARQARQVDWPLLIEAGSLDGSEYRVVTKSGRFLDVIAAATVERGADGRVLHVLGGLTDVTARKLAEDALRQAQKIEAIGQLTGGIAHDFNNLLAAVLGNLELLARRMPDDTRLKQLVQNATEGASRGASLTQRLLAFARRQDLKPERIDVPRLVMGMTDLLQRSLGPMIKVETRFPLILPSAKVDANQLEMAILNLAVNARDAMKEGGTLTISAAAHVEGDGESNRHKPGSYVRIALADSGSGMDQATLARAVDPFFTTKGVGKGTGLGLSMVQGLAAQSEGWFELDSSLGLGTIAALYLPVATPDATEAVDKAVETAVDQGLEPLSILIVDDNRLVLTNTAAMLDDLGHHVRAVSSGNDALELLENDDTIELLVTDQLMPGMTGVELIERVRRTRPRLPVLLVSGFADLDRSLKNDVPRLAKPFTRAQLAGAVRATFDDAKVVPIKRRR